MRDNFLRLFLVCIFLCVSLFILSCTNSVQKDKESIENSGEINQSGQTNDEQNIENTIAGNNSNNSQSNNQSSINKEVPNITLEDTQFFIRNQISELLSGLIRIKVDVNNYEDCVDSSKINFEDGTEQVRVYRIHNIQQYDTISDYVTYSNKLSYDNNIYPYYQDDTEGFTDEMLASLKLSDSLITKMAVTTRDSEIFTKFDEYIILGKFYYMPLDGGSFNSSESNKPYRMLDYTYKNENIFQNTKYSSYLVIPIKDGKISFSGLTNQEILEYSSDTGNNFFQFNPYLEEKYRLNEGDSLEDIEKWYIELTKLVANSPVAYGKNAIKYDDGTIYHKVYVYDIVDGEKILNKDKYFYGYIYEGWKLQILDDDQYIIKGYNDTIYIDILDENNRTSKLYLYSDIFLE